MATKTESIENATRNAPKPIIDALHDILANSVGMLDDLIATRRQMASQVVDAASAALTRIAWSAGAATGRAEATPPHDQRGGA